MTLCRCQHSLRCVQEQQRRRRHVSALPALQGAEAAASSCTCTATCKAGFAIGGVPTVNSNDSGWGTDGSMPIALETWYQFQVTDNISVTPGVFWVSGQNDEKTGKYGQVTMDASNGDVWGGIVKTEFKF